MPYTEYLGWQAYFAARPVGWREDNRIMPLLQVQGCKAKPQEIFPSMIPIMNPASVFAEKQPEGMINTSSLKQSLLFSKLANANGGDKLDLFGGGEKPQLQGLS